MEYQFVLNDNATTSVLWRERPDVGLPYVAILGVAAVVGTAGNLLVIATLALMSHRRQRGVGNVFVLNLALSDLIVTALINPFSITGVIKGTSFFYVNLGLCRGLASVCVISCVVSLLTIGNIAINRYIYICHHSKYAKIYSKSKCVLACMATWLLGVAIDLPSHLGWSRHTFDKKTHKCIFDRRYKYAYTAFFCIVGVMLPLVVIIIFYLKIFLHMSAAKIKLDKYAHLGSHKIFYKTLRQARMMFATFVSFAICWSPYVFVLLLDKDDVYPLEAHLFTSLVAHLHASLNFVIYGLNNKMFREGYRVILTEKLTGCCCCQAAVSQAAQDPTSPSTCYEDLTSPIFEDQHIADGFCQCLQNDTNTLPSKSDKCLDASTETKTLTPLSPLHQPSHINGFLPVCQNSHPQTIHDSPKTAKDIDTSSI